MSNKKNNDLIKAYKIIDNAQYGVLCLAKDNEAYGVSLSIVRVEDTLYFHTGQKGQKIEFINSNHHISITFVGEVEVPHLYDKNEIEEIVNDPSNHGKFVNSVFTTSFESVIIIGEAIEVIDENKKIEIMRAICQKYTPDMMDYFDIPINRSLSITKTFKVDIRDLELRSKKVEI